MFSDKQFNCVQVTTVWIFIIPSYATQNSNEFVNYARLILVFSSLEFEFNGSFTYFLYWSYVKVTSALNSLHFMENVINIILFCFLSNFNFLNVTQSNRVFLLLKYLFGSFSTFKMLFRVFFLL